MRNAASYHQKTISFTTKLSQKETYPENLGYPENPGSDK